MCATKALQLTYLADSSALNGRPTGSWGGHAARQRQDLAPGEPSTAVVSWQVLTPKKLADSSGGAELILGSITSKEAVSMRVQHTEIGFAPQRPTLVHMDPPPRCEASRWCAFRSSLGTSPYGWQ